MTQFTPEELARLNKMLPPDAVAMLSGSGGRVDRSNQNLQDIMAGKQAPLDTTTRGEELGILADTAVARTQKIGNNLVGATRAIFGDTNGILASNTKNEKIDQAYLNDLNNNQKKAITDSATFGQNYLAKGSQIAGDLAPVIAGNIGATVVGGIGGAAAFNGALMGTDASSLVFQEKYQKLLNEGLSQEEAISQANSAAGVAGLQAGSIGAALGAANKLTGAHTGGLAVNAVNPATNLGARGVGGLVGGVTDAASNAIVGGPVMEAIRSSNVGDAFSNERAKEGAIAGALVGGALGGVFGQGAGKTARVERSALDYTRANYNNHEVESGLMSQDAATRRAALLSNRNDTPYEVLPSINADSETLGSKFVVAKRKSKEEDGNPDSLLDFRQKEAERLAKQTSDLKATENVQSKEQTMADIVNNYKENTRIQEESNNPLQAVAEIVRGREELNAVDKSVEVPKTNEDITASPIKTDEVTSIKTDDILSTPKVDEVPVITENSNISESTLSGKVNDIVQPKISETVDTQTVVTKETASITNKDNEVRIPEFKEKFEKRNYGLESSSKEIHDEAGNVKGFQFKATVARPNEFGLATEGKDHLGISIQNLQEIFTTGYKNITLVREPNNPKDNSAIRIMADDKLLGYLPNQKESKWMADQLSEQMDSGNIKTLHAELHAERAPYSGKSSDKNDSFVFSKDGDSEVAYRPIIEVKTSFDDSINARNLKNNNIKIEESEIKKSQNKEEIDDDFISKLASDYVGKDVSKMSNEELGKVFSESREKSQAFIKDTFDSVRNDLQKEFSAFSKDFDLIIKHGGDLFDVTGSDKNLQAIKNIINKPENSDTAGYYAFDPETGRGSAVVDLVSIHADMSNPNSPLSSIGTIQDAAKFVLFHEALGHGSLSKYFKTPEERNVFLEKAYNDSEIIRDIAEVKARVGYDRNDKAGLAEEVLADMAGGKVQTEVNGKIVYKDLNEFLQTYKDNVPALQRFYNSFKELVNTVFGKPIFKLDSEAKTFEQIVKEMTSIADTVKESPYIKAKNEFLADESISKAQKDLTLKFALGSSGIYDPELMYSRADTFKAYLAAILPAMSDKNKVSYIKSPDYLAAKDPIYRVGHVMIREKDMASPRYENMMTNLARKIKSLSPASGRQYQKLLNEQVVNKKPFTDAELAAKGLTGDITTAYKLQEQARVISIELATKAEMVGIAFKKELITREEHRDVARIENYTPDQLAKTLLDLAKNKLSIGRADKEMQEILNKRDQGLTDIKLGRIERNATGDYNLVVRDKTTGEMRDLRQYTSKFERQKDFNLLSKKYGDKMSIEKGTIPKDPKLLADYESNFKKILLEAEENNLPFDAAKTLAKSFNIKSKQISKDLWNANINRYVKELESEGKTDISNDLYLRNMAVDKPDNTTVAKMKQVTSILALGGNIASGIANYMGIPLNLTPWLMQHGGAKHVPAALALAHKTILNNKLSQADFVKKMSSDSFFNGHDPREVTSALNEMYSSNLLFEQHSPDMNRLINGSQIKDGAKYAQDFYMGIQSKTEQIAKVTSLLSGIKTGLEAGKKGHELHDFAKTAVFETQGYYGKSGRPLWAQNAIGQMLYQFKKYPQTTVELFMKLAKNDNKIPAVVMATILGSVVGGGGLPFVSNIADIYDTINKALGNKSSDIKEVFRNGIKEMLGDDAGRIALHGLLSDSVIPGDFSSKLSMDSLLPATDLFDETNRDKTKTVASLLGASGNNMFKLLNGINDVFKGDGRKAFFDTAPGPLKNAFQGFEGATTGEFKNSKGQKIIEANGRDSLLKGIGINPKSLAVTNRINDEFATKKMNIENAKSIIYEKMAYGILNKDEDVKQSAREHKEEWNKDNPNNKIRINLKEVAQMVKRSNQDEATRDYKAINKEYKADIREANEELKK